MLDNVIDINFYPSAKAKYSNLRHRPIGLGVMGYMEWLVKHGIDFESENHLEQADELFEKISFCAIEASCDLADERGAYATFAGSKWDRGILPIDTARDGKKRLWWDLLRDKIKEQGMRNCNVMAIAPTATISNIAGTTPCIEPIYKRTYSETNMSGSFLVVDPTLRYGHPELCKESFDIDQMWIVKAAAVRQKWIDQSQSVNIFVKAGIKGSQLAEIYMAAWELGLKTTYYLHSQSTQLKVKQVETKEAEEVKEVNFCSITQPDCEACQ
jgi:ribonucleoside-diphosphate reductase alpha chain